VLINRLHSNEHIVLIVGSTALSIVQYERGRTAHSAFGIPVTEVVYLPRNQYFKYSESSYQCVHYYRYKLMELQSRIGRNSDQAQSLRNVETILGKEIPMSNLRSNGVSECTIAATEGKYVTIWWIDYSRMTFE